MKKTPKILFLAQLPPPFHGQSVVTGAMYRILKETVNADIFHLWKGGAKTATDVGKRSLGKYYGFLSMTAGLTWHLVRGERYDVAYLGMAPWAHTVVRDCILILLARMLSTRVWLHVHGDGLEQYLKPHSFKQKIANRILRNTELVAITADAAKAGNESKLFHAVHHLPNFADDPGNGKPAHGKTIHLGTVGNLDPRKGVFEFVQTVQSLTKEGHSVRGTIIGGPTAGLSVEAMKAHVKKTGLAKQITVTGRVSEEEKKRLLNETDIFLYPSRHDLAPLALIEALAHSCVPISFKTGGIPEIAGPEMQANILPLYLDADEFASVASKRIATYIRDRNLLGKDARIVRQRFVKHYSEAGFTRNVLEMLKSGNTPLQKRTRKTVFSAEEATL